MAQASVVRRLGDLPRARRLLDDGMARYELLGVAAGCAAALAGLAWWALAAGDPDTAASFATPRPAWPSPAGIPTPSWWPRRGWPPSPSWPIPRSSIGSSWGRVIAGRRGFSGGVYAAILETTSHRAGRTLPAVLLNAVGAGVGGVDVLLAVVPVVAQMEHPLVLGEVSQRPVRFGPVGDTDPRGRARPSPA